MSVHVAKEECHSLASSSGSVLEPNSPAKTSPNPALYAIDCWKRDERSIRLSEKATSVVRGVQDEADHGERVRCRPQ